MSNPKKHLKKESCPECMGIISYNREGIFTGKVPKQFIQTRNGVQERRGVNPFFRNTNQRGG